MEQQEHKPDQATVYTTDKPLGTDHDGKLAIRWPHQLYRDQGGLVSSFDQSTERMRLWILSVWESEVEKGAEWIGRDMSISDYICGPVTMSDEETGEETDGIRTLFIGPDHTPVAFVAQAALKAIAKISAAKGSLPPWDPPVMVRVKQVSGRGARRTYKFVPIVNGPEGK